MRRTGALAFRGSCLSGILLDVSYLGNKGTHVLQNVYNWDHLGPQVEQYTSDQIATLKTYVPNPFYGIITNPTSSLSSSTVPAYQLQLPYPQFTSVNGDNAPWDNTSYNALQVKLEKRFAHGLQFLVTYTWSKSIDDASLLGGAGELGRLYEPSGPERSRARTGFVNVLTFRKCFSSLTPTNYLSAAAKL